MCLLFLPYLGITHLNRRKAKTGLPTGNNWNQSMQFVLIWLSLSLSLHVYMYTRAPKIKQQSAKHKDIINMFFVF